MCVNLKLKLRANPMRTVSRFDFYETARSQKLLYGLKYAPVSIIEHESGRNLTPEVGTTFAIEEASYITEIHGNFVGNRTL